MARQKGELNLTNEENKQKLKYEEDLESKDPFIRHRENISNPKVRFKKAIDYDLRKVGELIKTEMFKKTTKELSSLITQSKDSKKQLDDFSSNSKVEDPRKQFAIDYQNETTTYQALPFMCRAANDIQLDETQHNKAVDFERELAQQIINFRNKYEEAYATRDEEQALKALSGVYENYHDLIDVEFIKLLQSESKTESKIKDVFSFAILAESELEKKLWSRTPETKKAGIGLIQEIQDFMKNMPTCDTPTKISLCDNLIRSLDEKKNQTVIPNTFSFLNFFNFWRKKTPKLEAPNAVAEFKNKLTEFKKEHELHQDHQVEMQQDIIPRDAVDPEEWNKENHGPKRGD